MRQSIDMNTFLQGALVSSHGTRRQPKL